MVHAPDYTYIRFKVMDEDWGPNADDFIGQFSAPLESIMPGVSAWFTACVMGKRNYYIAFVWIQHCD